ncbi:hypothetical protein EV193_112131 [Herbihabitans rhizosphaerae]|uniref:Uncharacterized protein n=1 Tax=Herbihabitans rhizosphaerae TaxID=1872711 RepID=A0A4Q7KGX4_9PSEU|nr:hypothetical protein [Herbihabitans rhizosphaerae]RZS32497.1 hypothetical protein EV193_112131 [Herbihabitans rhizosphaerae]
MSDRNPPTPGGDTPSNRFLSEEDHQGLARWRAIVAQRPPMTTEQIESVAALLRTIGTDPADHDR